MTASMPEETNHRARSKPKESFPLLSLLVRSAVVAATNSNAADGMTPWRYPSALASSSTCARKTEPRRATRKTSNGNSDNKK
jgi:hypothetical protein